MTIKNIIKCCLGMHDRFYLPYVKPVGLLAFCSNIDSENYPTRICIRCWKEIL